MPHGTLAGSLLTSGAGKSASVIDSFVSWLVAGTGAALVLLIGNLAEITPYLPVSAVKAAAVLFLIAASLTIVEKYLASIIVGAAETAAQAAAVGSRLADDEIDVDFSVVFREVEAAILPPMRWFFVRSVAKVKRGDFAASGRNFARCAQLQGVLGLSVTIVVLWALGLVVFRLGG